MVRSPSTGAYSTFVFEPNNNLNNQGPMLYQQWITNRVNETTGTNGSWPWATGAADNGECVCPCVMLCACVCVLAGSQSYGLNPCTTFAGQGWWCSGNCLLNGTGSAPAGAQVGINWRRNLKTFVNGLNNDSLPLAQAAYNDSIIAAFGIDLGGYTPATTSFVESLLVQSSPYSWRWQFGPVRGNSA